MEECVDFKTWMTMRLYQTCDRLLQVCIYVAPLQPWNIVTDI